jgi:hypothetical protein
MLISSGRIGPQQWLHSYRCHSCRAMSRCHRKSLSSNSPSCIRVAQLRKRTDSSFCGKRHLPGCSFTVIFGHAAVSTGLVKCIVVKNNPRVTDALLVKFDTAVPIFCRHRQSARCQDKPSAVGSLPSGAVTVFPLLDGLSTSRFGIEFGANKPIRGGIEVGREPFSATLPWRAFHGARYVFREHDGALPVYLTRWKLLRG